MAPRFAPPWHGAYSSDMQWWQQPFFQVALPIVIAMILSTWYQSSRIDDVIGPVNDMRDSLGKRIDDVRDSLGKRIDDLRGDMNNRFTAVEKRLEKLEARVEGLQERTWR